MSKQFARRTLAAATTTLWMICSGGGALAAERHVQTIEYAGGAGAIRHLKEPGATKAGSARICLRNRTSRPKAIAHAVPRVNPIRVQGGGEGCVSLPANFRFAFTFEDGGRVVHRDAMNLGAYAGHRVIFEWVADEADFQAGYDCGRDGQRACKLWERIPSCNANLVEVLGRGVCVDPKKAGEVCGRKNQRPCTLTERIPSCNAGLVEDFAKGKCVVDEDAARRELASTISAATREHQEILVAVHGCMATHRSELESAVDAKDLAASQAAVDQCLSPEQKKLLSRAPAGLPASSGVDAATDAYFNSLTVGLGGGFIVGVGLSGDLGVAIGLNGEPARFYSSGEWAYGFGLSVGADVIVGLGRDPVQPAISDNVTIVAAGKYLAGGGIGVVFDYGDPLTEDIFDGLAFSGGVGIGAEIGTVHKSNSRIW